MLTFIQGTWSGKNATIKTKNVNGEFMPRSPWSVTALCRYDVNPLFHIYSIIYCFLFSYSQVKRSRHPVSLSPTTEILLLRLFRKAFLTTLNIDPLKAHSFKPFSQKLGYFWTTSADWRLNTNTLCCSVVALEEVMCYFLTKLFFFGWDGQTGWEKNSRHEVYFCCQPLADNPRLFLPTQTTLNYSEFGQTSNCAGCQFSIGRGIFFILVDFLLGKLPRPMTFPCFSVVAFYFSYHTKAVWENPEAAISPSILSSLWITAIIKKFLLWLWGCCWD